MGHFGSQPITLTGAHTWFKPNQTSTKLQHRSLNKSQKAYKKPTKLQVTLSLGTFNTVRPGNS